MRVLVLMKWAVGGLVLSALAAGPVIAQGPDQAEERYWAILRSGTEVGATTLTDWADPDKTARLDKTPLFAPRNPVRLLCDRSVSVALTGPRLLFQNGDILPGQVTEIRPADPTGGSPAYALVQLAAPFIGPDNTAPLLPVRLDAVRRLLMTDDVQEDYQPNSIILKDGRRLSVLGLRWTRDGVRVLVQGQILSLALKDLAEVDLPAADLVHLVLAQNAYPGPRADGLIGRLRASNGAALTFRSDMLRPLAIQTGAGHHAKSSLACVQVQPGWALEPLTLPVDEVAVSDYWRPTDVPLSLLPARTLQEKSYTGYLWHWRRNLDVRGGLLEVGRMSADLGVGMHSLSQVAFTLPPSAQAFWSIVGLARDVGSGGCVNLQVTPDDPGHAPLWRRDFVRGTDGPIVVGPVPLPQAAGQMVLSVGFADHNRPQGADPMDIRDRVNWLMPLVEIDRAVLPQPQQDWRYYLPVLDDWQPGVDLAQVGRLGVNWDPSGRRWEMTLDTAHGGYQLTRRIEVLSPDAALGLTVARTGEGAAPILTLQVAGSTAAPQQLDTRSAQPGADATVSWPLRDFVNKTINLVLTVSPPSGATMGPLAWRRLGITGNGPPAHP